MPRKLNFTKTAIENVLIPAHVLKRLLNHSTGSDVKRLREPMQKITGFILKAAGVKESTTIIPLKRKEV